MSSRALSLPPSPGPGPSRLYQQAALRRLSRLRPAADVLRRRAADRRDRSAARHRPDRAAPQEHDRRPAMRWFRGQQVLSNGLAACLDAVRARQRLAGIGRAARARLASAAPSAWRAAAHISGLLGNRCHRPHARGRLRRPQHRRHRYRPGLRHRADPDLRRGAEDPGRAGRHRQPRYRRLALQLGHHRQPGHLYDRPRRRRRRPRCRAASSSSTPARCWNAPSAISSSGPAGASASSACRQARSPSPPFRRAPIGPQGGPIIGDHSLVFERMTRDPKRALAQGLPFPQIGVFSLRRRRGRDRDRRGHGQDEDRARPGRRPMSGARSIRSWSKARSKAPSSRAWASRWSRRWSGTGRVSPILRSWTTRCPAAATRPTTSMRSSSRRPSRTGPFGAKGVGEIGINAVPAAIANAIALTTGQRHRALPMTCERVFDAIMAGGSFVMMTLADYPPQEPLSPVGQAYDDRVRALGAGVTTGGEDLAYGSDPYQRVLIYRSPRPSGAMLAFIHGGGWTNGCKEWMAFMAPAVTGAGFDFASIGYRLAPAHVFPAGLEDCADCGGAAAGADTARTASSSAATPPADTMRRCSPYAGTAVAPPRSRGQSAPRLPARFGSLSLRRGIGPLATARAFWAEGCDRRRPARFLHHSAAAAVPDRLWRAATFPHLMPQAEEMAGGAPAKDIGVERWFCRAGTISPPAIIAANKGPWLDRATAFITRPSGLHQRGGFNEQRQLLTGLLLATGSASPAWRPRPPIRCGLASQSPRPGCLPPQRRRSSMRMTSGATKSTHRAVSMSPAANGRSNSSSMTISPNPPRR